MLIAVQYNSTFHSYLKAFIGRSCYATFKSGSFIQGNTLHHHYNISRRTHREPITIRSDSQKNCRNSTGKICPLAENPVRTLLTASYKGRSLSPPTLTIICTHFLYPTWMPHFSSAATSLILSRQCFVLNLFVCMLRRYRGTEVVAPCSTLCSLNDKM
jgi:hypothetical protein